MTSKKITYNFQGVEKTTRNSAIRYIISALGIPFLKSLFRLVPGIDNSVYKKGNGQELYVEIVPAFLGMFTRNWVIRQRVVKAFNSMGVLVRSMHAPYVEDGKIFQPPRKSYFENLLDVTNDSTETVKCLQSHIALYSRIAPREQEKVLIVHPLPSSPYKSEIEIVNSISGVVKKLLPMLRDENVKLVIENMPWLKKKHERYSPFLGDVLFFEKLMNEVNDPYYGTLFDWGHANTYARFMYLHGVKHHEFTFTPEVLSHFGYQEYFIKKLPEKIYYAHLNYNEAHNLEAKPVFYAKNFDSHSDLTHMNEIEYEEYKKNVQLLNKLPHLIGMTIESIPSYTNKKRRIQRYKDSVEILNSMLQSTN